MLERKQGLMRAGSCIQGTGHLARVVLVLGSGGSTKGNAVSVEWVFSCTEG